MTELLELEPRETATEDLDVDSAFTGVPDASRDHTRCPHCRPDDTAQWFFATSIPW